MVENNKKRAGSVGKSFFLYTLFVFIIVYISYVLNTIPSTSIKLTHASFHISDVGVPADLRIDGEDEKSIAVMLPDMNTASMLKVREGWYSIPIPDSLPLSFGDKLSIYVPILSTNIEVFINEHWLGNGGRINHSASKNTHHPLMFNMNSKQLYEQNNKLFIHIKGGIPEWTYLGEIYIGNEDVISPVFHKQEILKVDVIIAVTVGLFITGILTFIFGVLRREETYYFWYSGAEILWAIHDLKLFIKEPMVNAPLWETISILAIGWSFLGFVFFIHRYVGEYNKKWDKRLLQIGCVLSAPFIYQNIDWLTFYGYKVWLVFILMSGGYLFYYMFTMFKKTKDKNVLLMLMTGGVMLSFGVHDLLAVNAIIPPSSPYLLHFSAILIIFVITSMLLRRFVESLRIVENYNDELRGEVSRKEKQLHLEYMKIQKLQEEQVINKERERIMRDIHDGMGGQLVVTMASIDNPETTRKEIKNNVQIAIQDLRMVIDSFDAGYQDIAMILGMVRGRLEPLLKKSNIELIWKVDDSPEGMEKFGPQRTLHTMRIIQEAVTNVIKHSHATRITVTAYTPKKSISSCSYSIIVEDNGSGFQKPMGLGKGVGNMKTRANEMGAKLVIDSTIEKGTAVKLLFSY